MTAIKKDNLEGLTFIAAGNTAEVYRIDGTTRVLKLYNPNFPTETAEKEYLNMRAVNPLPFRKPKAYDMIKRDRRDGIIMDEVGGVPLISRIFGGELTADEAGELMAEVHKSILCNTVSKAVMSFKDFLRWGINANYLLDGGMKKRLLDRLARLPEGETLCHGDFHPGNVMCLNGDCTVIDFINASRGMPSTDIARTIYLVGLSYLPPETPNRGEVLSLRKRFIDVYKSSLGALYDEREVNEWLPLILAARTAECCGDEESERSMSLLKQMKI